MHTGSPLLLLQLLGFRGRSSHWQQPGRHEGLHVSPFMACGRGAVITSPSKSTQAVEVPAIHDFILVVIAVNKVCEVVRSTVVVLPRSPLLGGDSKNRNWTARSQR